MQILWFDGLSPLNDDSDAHESEAFASWLTARTLLAGLLVATGHSAVAAEGADLARGKPVSVSSSTGQRAAITDGNPDSVWESVKSGQQWVMVDLGENATVGDVVLKVPGDWSARTQHLTVQTSADGAVFTTAAASVNRTFDPRDDNTVKIGLGAVEARYVKVGFVTGGTQATAQLSSLEVYAAAESEVKAVRSVTASSSLSAYGVTNATDGNAATYWESANNQFPQWIQADLGASVATDRVVLKLPAGWEARTQTLTVQHSTNGTTFADLVASAGYQFNPASGNTVTIAFNATTTRYVRLTSTANTGWPAAQLAEFEVHGPATGDTRPPTAPADLAFTQDSANPAQIALSWSASTDDVGVTGYDVYANNTLRTSLPASARGYTDAQPVSATVAYFVRARDAAGNQSPDSNTVTRTGTSAGTNLALGKPITASGHVHDFVATNANDGSVNTYWEGNSGYPNTLTVGLGPNASITSVIVKLNPDQAWGPRTQTFQVLGRDQDATGFTNVVSSQQYTFNPSSGNQVTATAAELRLQFTANTGAPAGQVTGLRWTPQSPSESSPITLSATVRNAGDRQSAATSVTFYLGTGEAGTAAVGTLDAGATVTFTVAVGPNRTIGDLAGEASGRRAVTVSARRARRTAPCSPGSRSSATTRSARTAVAAR